MHSRLGGAWLAVSYSLAALREYRETRERAADQPALTMEMVPTDAPIEDPNAILHVWAGDRWIPHDKWLASAPIVREEPAAALLAEDADCWTAVCGGTRVWLVRDGGARWRMYAGNRRTRRKDFCSPWLDHARRTAECWYGVPEEAWRAERT